MIRLQHLPLLCVAFAMGCANDTSTSTSALTIPFQITELSDADYPDNPDIGFRASSYQFNYFGEGSLTIDDINHSSICFYSEDSKDTLKINELSLLEFIPKIPERFKSDQYLSLITLINQEWNRNQVRFLQGEFNSSDLNITRIDLARNCLNAKL